MGKGFAVAAAEVGNLANNTQESLKVVQAVIERVQQNVKDITTQVEENAQKLGTQNEYFADVFEGMQDMKELLNVSVNAVNTMGDVHCKSQSINAMAGSNAKDTAELANQAGIINNMADQMAKLLNREE